MPGIYSTLLVAALRGLTKPHPVGGGHPPLRGLEKVPAVSQRTRKDGAPRQKADSSPLKRIRNDKYLKAGSRRGAPRNDKYVKADSVRLREKSPHPFAKNAKRIDWIRAKARFELSMLLVRTKTAGQKGAFAHDDYRM